MPWLRGEYKSDAEGRYLNRTALSSLQLFERARNTQHEACSPVLLAQQPGISPRNPFPALSPGLLHPRLRKGQSSRRNDRRQRRPYNHRIHSARPTYRNRRHKSLDHRCQRQLQSHRPTTPASRQQQIPSRLQERRKVLRRRYLCYQPD